ncbi:hypothetical protein ASE16_02595 [Leifsonia sp. Root227]|uniref:sugar-binding transcriptional regulator n=1 Tax=Leifsonia sp. Root227 TaxID=1736496 RepID=UPI0006F9A3D1|nr:sugar-binding domain-containing protein [Leifsonia sp. Root227]KRC51972.1 hypothetical protein ASE16_02595 [Leifsonia sp. Root227]
MVQPPGPTRQVQIAHIATEYYLHGRTRIEIAESTGLSRFKVGRLLEEAVEVGIVRFEIASPSGVRLDLSVQLRERFGLEHVVVVDVPIESPTAIQESLGGAAAELLQEILGEDDVLGVTSGRTINAMARSLQSLPCRRVVQLAGAAGPILQSGLEVMRRLSTIGGVRPSPIYSSLVMSDAQAAEGVRRQPDVRQTFDQFSRVTVAIGAIGSWLPRNSLMIENHALTDTDRQSLLDKGVVAEIAATLVTDSGDVINDLNDRFIAITEEQLRAIPTIVAVAGGASKTRAIRAVLNAKLLTGLVTDSETAERLIGG